MLSRRSFISAAAASLVSLPAVAKTLGVRALPMLEDALNNLDPIVEGSGPPVHVIVAPGCSKAGDLWEATRPVVDRLQFRWLPFGFGIDEDVGAVAAAYETGDASGIQHLLLGDPVELSPSNASLARAQRQDLLFESEIGKLLWESTQMAPATPTLGFAVPGGGFRVVRGAIPAERFTEVIQLTGA